MDLKIISAEAELYNAEIQAVFFPGKLGEFEVLPHHGDMIAALEEGPVRIRTDKGESRLGIKSGFVKIVKDKITACVEI
ncbi:MAG: F0F1 ATP synthase subunit epsilon [Candidatus Cryptobacteroides sp.]